MIVDLLKAFAIGVLASVPVGPTAVFVLQKTLNGGRKVGFTTALGATLIDTTYSAIAIIAVAVVEDYILAHQNVIMLIGGVIVCAIGLNMALKKVSMSTSGNVSAGNTVQAMLCALANPGAIAAMLALVAVFKIDVEAIPIWAIIPCVAAGSMSYWLVFTKVFSSVRKVVDEHKLKMFNRVAGIIVFLLGAVLLVKGIISL